MLEALRASLAIDFDFFLDLAALKREIVVWFCLREFDVKSSGKAVIYKK
jgi:hypothetical protein